MLIEAIRMATRKGGCCCKACPRCCAARRKDARTPPWLKPRRPSKGPCSAMYSSSMARDFSMPSKRMEPSGFCREEEGGENGGGVDGGGRWEVGGGRREAPARGEKIEDRGCWAGRQRVT